MSFERLISALYPAGLPDGSTMTVGYVQPTPQWGHYADFDGTMFDQAGFDPNRTAYFMPSVTGPLSTHEKGTAADVVAMPALWLDIDRYFEGHKTSGAAEHHVVEMLRSLALEGLVPSIEVDTGGGLHLYFLLEDLAVGDEIVKAVGLNHRLRVAAQRHLSRTGSMARLDSVGNADRLLRPPGSWRVKDFGPRRPAELVRCDPTVRYSLDMLDRRLDPLPRVRVADPSSPIDGGESVADRARALYDATVSCHEVFEAAGWVRHGLDGWDHPGATVSPSAVVLDDSTSHAADWPEGVRDMAVIYSGSILAALELDQPLRLRPSVLAQHLLEDGDGSAFAHRAIKLANDGTEAYLARWGITSHSEASERGMEAPSDTDEPPTDEWSEPEPLGVPDTRPDFPLEIFPPEARRIIEHVSWAIEAPVDIAAHAVLGAYSALGTWAGLDVRLTEGRKDRSNIWICIVAPPSVGKSPIFKAITGPLRAIEVAHQGRRRSTDKAALTEYRQRERAVDKLEKAHIENPDKYPPPTAQQYLEVGAEPPITATSRLISTGTVEAAEKYLSENGGALAIVSAEGSMLGDIESYKSAGAQARIDPLLGPWSGDFAHVARADSSKRRELPDDSRICQLMAIQPSIAESFVRTEHFRRTGFLIRYMICEPDPVPNRTHRHDLDKTKLALWAEHLEHLDARLSAFGGVGRKAKFSTEASEAHRAYHRWIDSVVAELGYDDDELMLSAPDKIAESVKRTLGVLHYAHGHTEHQPITAEAVELGWRLGRYWFGHLLRLVRRVDLQARRGARGDDANLGRVARSLVNSPFEGSFTVAQMTRRNRAFDSEAVVEALEQLRQLGWIRTEDGGRVVTPAKGRSPQRLHAHPEIAVKEALLRGNRGQRGTSPPSDLPEIAVKEALPLIGEEELSLSFTDSLSQQGPPSASLTAISESDDPSTDGGIDHLLGL